MISEIVSVIDANTHMATTWLIRDDGSYSITLDRDYMNSNPTVTMTTLKLYADGTWEKI